MVYVYGAAQEREGLYYSEDLGESWTYVELAINWINNPRSLTADGRDFGRIYIGSNGSGILSVTLLDEPSVTSIPLRTGTTGTAQELLVWPNPAHTEVNFGLNSPVAYTASMVWYDAAGRRLRTESVRITAGESQISSSLVGLPHGPLTAVLYAPDGPLVFRLTKQ